MGRSSGNAYLLSRVVPGHSVTVTGIHRTVVNAILICRETLSVWRERPNSRVGGFLGDHPVKIPVTLLSKRDTIENKNYAVFAARPGFGGSDAAYRTPRSTHAFSASRFRNPSGMTKTNPFNGRPVKSIGLA